MKSTGFAPARSRAAHALASIFLICAAAPAFADSVVVTADRMLDVLTGRTVEHPQIIITDGRIAAIATMGAAIPAGARRVDLPGMTLLPGLIDMHTHLTSDPHFSGYRRLQFTDNFWTVVGVANAKQDPRGGLHHDPQCRIRKLRRRRDQTGHRTGHRCGSAHRSCDLCDRRNRRPLRFHRVAAVDLLAPAGGCQWRGGNSRDGAQIAQVRR